MAQTQYIETDKVVKVILCDGREFTLQKEICITSDNRSLTVNGSWDSANKCYKYDISLPTGSATFDDIIVSSQLVTTDLGMDGDIDVVEMEYTTAGGAKFTTDITALISTMTDNDDGTITHSTLLGDFTISLCKLLNDSADNGNASLPTDKVLVMQTDGSCELKTISGGSTITANNDLGLTAGTLQTGFPLVKNTETTGAYYRNWSNNTNTNPNLSLSGVLYGYRRSLYNGYYNTALITSGEANFYSGYRHENSGGNGNIISGYQNKNNGSYGFLSGFLHENTGSYNTLLNYQNFNISGNYNFMSGFRSYSSANYSSFFGSSHGTLADPVRGSYSQWAGYRNRGNATYSSIRGYNNNVTGSNQDVAGGSNTVTGSSQRVGGLSNDAAGSYNDVAGYNHNVASSYNGVHGYNHNVTSFGNLIGGYRQTITANRTLAVGDQNTVSGSGHGVIGISHIVNGNYNTSIGYNHTFDSGSNNTALGSTNRIRNGSYSFALGFSHDMRGTGSGAIGYNHTFSANTNYSLALGRNHTFNGGNDKIFIGRNINVNTPNDSIIIGGNGQRIGFFEVPAITRQAGAGITTVAQLVTALRNYGLLT